MTTREPTLQLASDKGLPMPVIALIVNGREHQVDVPPDASLLAVLRNDLDLTGTKYGCGEGQCGACTVLVDGEPAKSCQVRASLVAGKAITTIEGLEQNGRLHPVQEAFLKVEAMQCGYCTPGMIMAVVGLLRSNPNPSNRDIVRAMDRNICRCGTYPRIVAAIREAAARGASQ